MRVSDLPRVAVGGAAVLASAAVLLSIGAGATSAHEHSASRDRTTTDMPDDFQGPQIHFLYVVPADGTDDRLDTNGVFEQSIARIQHWFLSQTGNQGLRVDTYHGVPDITFFRMSQTDAQATSVDPWPLWTIGDDLVANGFDDPNKVYAVFYGGHSSWACGGAKSPALPKLGAMYLKAWPTGDPAPCHSFGTGTTEPGYFDMGLLHEVLHALGFVPSCAPHVTQVDHVNDSPTDLMYAPDETHTAPWDVLNAVLDYNHDDYYRAHVPGCPDLSASPYLTPMVSLDVTEFGAGTVVSDPVGISCPPTCTAFLTPPVTLTATPAAGHTFTGWGGSCTGTATCTGTESGSLTAGFAVQVHERSLSLRVRAQRAAGSVQVGDGYSACRADVTVVVERRSKGVWVTVGRVHTGAAGAFVLAVPVGRASYRAVAPRAVVGGQQCAPATSPVATST